MEVTAAVADLDLVCAWHAVESALGVGPRLVHGGDLAGVADGLLAPCAGVHVAGRLAVGQQVHRNLGELQRGAALQEQDGELVGHRSQRTEVGQGVHVDGVVGRRAVACLDDRHAGAVEVEELVTHLFEDRHRKGARARAEVVDTGGRGHRGSPLVEPGPAAADTRSSVDVPGRDRILNGPAHPTGAGPVGEARSAVGEGQTTEGRFHHGGRPGGGIGEHRGFDLVGLVDADGDDFVGGATIHPGRDVARVGDSGAVDRLGDLEPGDQAVLGFRWTRPARVGVVTGLVG